MKLIWLYVASSHENDADFCFDYSNFNRYFLVKLFSVKVEYYGTINYAIENKPNFIAIFKKKKEKGVKIVTYGQGHLKERTGLLWLWNSELKAILIIAISLVLIKISLQMRHQ